MHSWRAVRQRRVQPGGRLCGLFIVDAADPVCPLTPPPTIVAFLVVRNSQPPSQSLGSFGVFLGAVVADGVVLRMYSTVAVRGSPPNKRDALTVTEPRLSR